MIVAFPTVSNPHSNPMRAAPAEVPRAIWLRTSRLASPWYDAAKPRGQFQTPRAPGTAVPARDAEPELGLECVRGYGSDRLDLHHRPPGPGPAPHGPGHVERELGMGRARPVHATLSPQEPREAEGSGPLEPGRGTRYAARCAVFRRGA